MQNTHEILSRAWLEAMNRLEELRGNDASTYLWHLHLVHAALAAKREG